MSDWSMNAFCLASRDFLCLVKCPLWAVRLALAVCSSVSAPGSFTRQQLQDAAAQVPAHAQAVHIFVASRWVRSAKDDEVAMKVAWQPRKQDSLANDNCLHSLHSPVVVEADIYCARVQLQNLCFPKWLFVRLYVHDDADLQESQDDLVQIMDR